MPLISVITESDGSPALGDTYDSIANQTHAQWEWVLFQATPSCRIPDRIQSDPRVRIVTDPSRQMQTGATAGARKNYAAVNATGAVLVFLHDGDLLTCDALQRVGDSWEAQERKGLIYSDHAIFRPNMTVVTRNSDQGWEGYQIWENGRPYMAYRSFELSPASLASPHTSPQYLLAWDRSAFINMAGFSNEYAVYDEYDLVCRTYRNKFETTHISDCLCLVREDYTRNPAHNLKAGSEQRAITTQHFDAIAREWALRSNLLLLNIQPPYHSPGSESGLQSVSAPGIGGEFEPLLGIDHDAVGYLKGWNVLQFVPPDKVSQAFHGIYERLAPGGLFTTATPSTDGRSAFMPNYLSFWNENSFWALTNPQVSQQCGIKGSRFWDVRKWTAAPNETAERVKELYVYADLIALKGQRCPEQPLTSSSG